MVPLVLGELQFFLGLPIELGGQLGNFSYKSHAHLQGAPTCNQILVKLQLFTDSKELVFCSNQ